MVINKDQYSLGKNIFSHRELRIASTLHTKEMDSLLASLDTDFDYDIGHIPNGYEHRPDLISHIFYGTPAFWWLLMLYNGITDPHEGFRIGQKIKIPKVKV